MDIWTAYPSSCQLEPQQHKFSLKYAKCFYWLEGAACMFCIEIEIVCLHVGQMLFADTKYLQLKSYRVGLIPASIGTVESVGLQMKQCWIWYKKKNPPKKY